MLYRSAKDELERLSTLYPVVTVTGPRQAGKTTLVKNCFPQKQYYNLENPDTRARIEADPKQFIKTVALEPGIILDEIQRCPDLLSYIQACVDDNRITGSFILTGNHQLQLSEAITQSLAGRTSLLELLPLSLTEYQSQHTINNVDDILLSGLFPANVEHHIDAETAARNYIKTYVERDVRQLIHLKDLNTFQRFLHLCAGRIGQLLNKETLANDVGISANTITHWLSILEASYILKQLPPYFENLGKRVIKSPKLYFYDVGLASYLLGLRTPEQVNLDRLRGNLFENLVYTELLKHFHNKGQDAPVYFYRDSHHNEVDFIINQGNTLIPIEVKITSTFNKSLLKNLNRFHDLVGDRAPESVLIYTGENGQIGKTQLVNFKEIQTLFS